MTATAPERRRSSLASSGDDNWAPSLRIGPNHLPAGQWVGGKIVWFDDAPETFEGKALTYPSGDPIYYTWINVQTDERNPEFEDDEGVRRLHFEGVDKRRTKRGEEPYVSKKRAARFAIQDAGADDLEIGGEIYVRWTEKIGRATNWEVVYRTPDQATGQAPAGTKPAKAAATRTSRSVRSVPAAKPAQDEAPPF
jgi:hypothetical protein